MATAVETKSAIKGGEFLIRETKAQDIFIPEELRGAKNDHAAMQRFFGQRSYASAQ